MPEVFNDESTRWMNDAWPTHRAVAERALAWGADPADPPFSVLEETLLSDPALTAHLLRLANSSLFGKPGKIASLAHAAALADRHLLRVATLQYRLLDPSNPSRVSFDHEAFWRRSWLRSRVAGHLAPLFPRITVDEARVAGLLMELGELIRAETPGVDGVDLDALTWGVAWMRGCEFPPFLVQAIEAQGEPSSIESLETRARDLADVLQIAGQWLEVAPTSPGAPRIFRSSLGPVELTFLEEEIAQDLERVDQVFSPAGLAGDELAERTRRALVEISMAHAHALTARTRQVEQHQRRAREYKKERDQLREQVTLDPFLGIANRKHFDRRLDEEFKRCLRNGQPLSLILFDIDRFKQLNDTYFHQAGDEVLISVTRVMKNCLRTTDLLARYGGEEFAVVCPETDIIGGLSLAERMRQALERQEILHQGIVLRVTASFGLATIEDPHEIAAPADLVEVADFFLYQAKKEGRNCVRHGACPHAMVPAVISPSPLPREAIPRS